MREVDRQIMCSNLNNELRQANIDLNAAYLRETNAKNALSTGKGDISRHEWNITQINVELSVMEVGSMVGGRVLSVVAAGRIAKLKDKKRRLQEKIAEAKRAMQDARSELGAIKNTISNQRGLIEQIEAEKNQLGC